MNNTVFIYDDIPYQIQHSLGALLIFIISLPVTKLFPSRHLDLLLTTTSPILYFAGREFRDLEKFGYMDIWGFLAPTIFSLVLGCICLIFRTTFKTIHCSRICTLIKIKIKKIKSSRV